MTIKQAEAFAINIPLKKPFTIAVGSLTHSNHVLVRLRDETGREGWGETSTFMEVYGYDQKAIFDALDRHLLPAVVGMDPADPSGLHRRMNQVMPFNNMAKAAVDFAAHDLAAKAAGVPIHSLLGGRKADRIPMIGVVDMIPAEQAAEMAAGLISEGYRTLKIKIGRDPEQDLARVAAVRKTAGDDIMLRVDGNTKYDLQTALKVFTSLDDLGLEWIEQPLAAWDWEGHAFLGKRLNTPIALDESVYTQHDAMHAIKLGAARVVNVKIVRCGGFYPSSKVVSVCESAGVPCFLGGVLETSPGMAANAHFYSAMPGVVSAGEFNGVDHFTDDIAVETLAPENGFLKVPMTPGLGVEVDWDRLSRYRVDWSQGGSPAGSTLS